MAAQTASPAPSPTAQVLANAFVEQYYHILHRSPELVHRFYQDTSSLSRPDPNGLMTTVTTMKSINDKICSLDYKNYKAEIKTVDAQDSYQDGVIVLVTGCLSGEDNRKKKFTQTFFLAPQDKGYYVLNDVFRYVEENEPETSGTVDIGAHEMLSSSVDQNPEPPQLVDPPQANYASPQVDEVEIIEGTDDQAIDGGQDNDTDVLVEADPHFNENHSFVLEESLASLSQGDTPKKSCASIVGSQTKKGPIKVYVPTNTAKVVSVKTEKQPLSSDAEVCGSESLVPVAPDNAPESKDDQEEEVEGHSIYIRNLPLNVTVSQLEAEFQRFGAIKPNGVQVKSNKGFCFGFVEFQEFSSMQSAVKGSPVTIEDRQAFVEIKRTTTRVGSGRDSVISSRGGFRGRGNYNGGRTYVRSDIFRGRGNVGGDGYQQGRGRGGRRPSPTPNSAST